MYLTRQLRLQLSRDYLQRNLCPTLDPLPSLLLKPFNPRDTRDSSRLLLPPISNLYFSGIPNCEATNWFFFRNHSHLPSKRIQSSKREQLIFPRCKYVEMHIKQIILYSPLNSRPDLCP